MGARVVVVIALAGCGRLDFTDRATSDTGVEMSCATDADCAPCNACGANNRCAPSPIDDLFVGHRTTCFLSSGSRWCVGQGNGLGASPAWPSRIAGEDGWSTLALGWGANYGIRNGELDGFYGPNGIDTLSDPDGAYAELAVEYDTFCTRRATGEIACNGAAYPGAWSMVSAGQDSQCGIQTDGTLWCWGTDASNALGLGVEPDGTVHAAPVQVGTFTDWIDVDIGSGVACGLRGDRSLWCWGEADQTGTNNIDTMGTPTQISPDTDWTSLEVESGRGCASKPDGRTTCWGRGDTNDVVPGVGDAMVPTEIGVFEQVRLGGHHVCVKTADVWSCWGWNAQGQLGTGDAVDRQTPGVPVCTAPS